MKGENVYLRSKDPLLVHLRAKNVPEQILRVEQF